MIHATRMRRKNRRPGIERLEDRRLMAVTITDIPLASSTTQINGVAAYPDGNIWFTATSPAELGVLHPATNFLLEFPLDIANSAPDAITVGKDGNLYFTDPGVFGQSAIGVFNPATLGRFEVPTPTVGADPNSIAVANDGTIWFTENAVGMVGEYDPATQKITEYSVGASNSGPNYIQLAPDGDLWFEETGAFASINPTTKAVTTIPFNVLGNNAPAGGFSITSDGDIHYVAVAQRTTGGGGLYAAATLDPTTSTYTVSPDTVPFGKGGPVPAQHVTASDGNVYYAEGPVGMTTVGEINVSAGTLATYSGGTNASDESAIAASGTTLYVGGLGVLGQAAIVPPDVAAVSGTVTTLAAPGGTGTPLAGRTVFVDLAGTGTFAPGDPSAVTDANGNYTITFVPLGTFNVDVVPYPGDFTFPEPVKMVGGAVSQNVNLSVQPSSAILPLTYSADPFGFPNMDTTTAEVVGLYKIILDRAPDPSGLSFFTTFLNNGGSLAVVASAMLHSTEYDTDLVTADYKNFLGRTASSAEIAGWVNLMQKGYSAEQVAYLFMTSAEFNLTHPDSASFVQALYGDVLGRSANAAEVSAWTAYLANSSRASMVNFFIHSPEAGIRAAQGFYAEFWATPIDAGGETAVVDALASGLTMADVASLFAVAPQFVSRAEMSVP